MAPTPAGHPLADSHKPRFYWVATAAAGILATVAIVLRFLADTHAEMVAHCLGGLPDEACGLLIGRHLSGTAGAAARVSDDAEVMRCWPTANDAASTRIYSIPPLDMLRADRAAEDDDLEIVGVFHSHTHTEAHPSPTDVAQAPDPAWRYVIVSLKRAEPSTRSWRIVDDTIAEECVAL